MLLPALLLWTSLAGAAPCGGAFCSCALPAPPDAYARAQAVFTGVVREVRASRGREESYTVRKDTMGDLVVTAEQLPRARQPTVFRVTRRWKGVAAGTAYVLNSGPCAVTFERGREYLVYARRDEDGTLSTTFCQGTRPVAQAGEDLRALGRPR